MSDKILQEFLSPLQAQVESSGEFSLDPIAALEKMAHSQLPKPGLWAVKCVQAAVAWGTDEVDILQGSTALQITLRGGRCSGALKLLEHLLSGKAPSGRGEAHLLAGLRGAYGRPLTSLSWLSRSGLCEERVQLRDGQVFSEELPLPRPATPEIIVVARYRQDQWFTARTSADEYQALCACCRLCPISVTVDSRCISQHPPTRCDDEGWMVSWPIDAQDEQPSFILHSGVGQEEKHTNRLVSSRGLQPGLNLCRALISANGIDKPERAVVYWMRDGALIGPYPVNGWIGPVRLEIVLPADHLETDLTEWFLRQPEQAFPAELLLETLQEIHRDLTKRNPTTVSTWASMIMFGVKESAIWLAANTMWLMTTFIIVPDPTGRAEARRTLASLLSGFASLNEVSELSLERPEPT